MPEQKDMQEGFRSHPNPMSSTSFPSLTAGAPTHSSTVLRITDNEGGGTKLRKEGEERKDGKKPAQRVLASIWAPVKAESVHLAPTASQGHGVQIAATHPTM